MRSLVCLLLLLLLPLPAAAYHDEMVADFARLQGYEGKLDIFETPNPLYLNGQFAPPQTICTWSDCITIEHPSIVLLVGADVPDELVLEVLAHELGHWEQWREGVLQRRSVYWEERDADVRGANMLCRAGYEGARLVEESYIWLAIHFNHYGGGAHGPNAKRVMNVWDRATSCRILPEAA
jgi:hypothetical protein